MRFVDDDYDASPEQRCMRLPGNRDLLTQISADSTSPEILDIADKLTARWYRERVEPLDSDILGYLLYETREWKRDRKSNR